MTAIVQPRPAELRAESEFLEIRPLSHWMVVQFGVVSAVLEGWVAVGQLKMRFGCGVNGDVSQLVQLGNSSTTHHFIAQANHTSVWHRITRERQWFLGYAATQFTRRTLVTANIKRRTTWKRKGRT